MVVLLDEIDTGEKPRLASSRDSLPPYSDSLSVTGPIKPGRHVTNDSQISLASIQYFPTPPSSDGSSSLFAPRSVLLPTSRSDTNLPARLQAPSSSSPQTLAPLTSHHAPRSASFSGPPGSITQSILIDVPAVSSNIETHYARSSPGPSLGRSSMSSQRQMYPTTYRAANHIHIQREKPDIVESYLIDPTLFVPECLLPDRDQEAEVARTSATDSRGKGREKYFPNLCLVTQEGDIRADVWVREGSAARVSSLERLDKRPDALRRSEEDYWGDGWTAPPVSHPWPMKTRSRTDIVTRSENGSISLKILAQSHQRLHIRASSITGSVHVGLPRTFKGFININSPSSPSSVYSILSTSVTSSHTSPPPLALPPFNPQQGPLPRPSPPVPRQVPPPRPPSPNLASSSPSARRKLSKPMPKPDPPPKDNVGAQAGTGTPTAAVAAAAATLAAMRRTPVTFSQDISDMGLRTVYEDRRIGYGKYAIAIKKENRTGSAYGGSDESGNRDAHKIDELHVESRSGLIFISFNDEPDIGMASWNPSMSAVKLLKNKSRTWTLSSVTSLGSQQY